MNNNKYIFDQKSNVYLELSEEEFIDYCKTHLTNKKTAFIMDEEQNRWIGFPAHIAVEIIQGQTTHYDFFESIKDKLLRI